MAKITYADKVALNENPNVNAINKVRDVDMNELKEVINDNETKVLLAVSSSAPATCDTGDIYFNTTDNLIYTATATDTWGSTGVAPTSNTIYLELTNQTAYAYNGTTLVSVGGGASGGGETLPIGTVLEFPTTDSTKVPDGWLFCDGSAVSRTTYADLFAIIGTSFGAGDGSTTFNLPTKEGLVSVGIKSSDTDFDTIGETGGSKELQQHNHTLQDDNGNNFLGLISSAYTGNNGWNVTNASSISNGGTLLGRTTKNAGTGNSGNLQPYTVTNYIIKATQTTPVQAEVVNDYSTSQENAYSCNYVNKNLVYSTTETDTGKRWINNKPIYRIVFEKTINATSNWTNYTLASLGISNYQYIYFGDGCRRIQGDRYVKDINTDQNVYIDTNNGTIDFGPDSQYKNIYTIVLEYTKTTD